MANFFTGYLALGGIVSGAFVEFSTADYARQAVTYSPLSNGATAPLTAPLFGPAAVYWGVASAAALWDSPFGGNLIAYWPCAFPLAVYPSQRYLPAGTDLSMVLPALSGTGSPTIVFPANAVMGTTTSGQTVHASPRLCSVVGGILQASSVVAAPGGTAPPTGLLSSNGSALTTVNVGTGLTLNPTTNTLSANAVNYSPLATFPAMNYGAFFDGVHDDYPGILAAYSAAVAAGGGIVVLPYGIGLLGTTLLHNNSNVRIVGGGVATLSQQTLANYGYATVLRWIGTANQPMVIVGPASNYLGSNAMPRGGTRISNADFTRITLDGQMSASICCQVQSVMQSDFTLGVTGFLRCGLNWTTAWLASQTGPSDGSTVEINDNQLNTGSLFSLQNTIIKTTLTSAVGAGGSATINVASAAGFLVGMQIGIGPSLNTYIVNSVGSTTIGLTSTVTQADGVLNGVVSFAPNAENFDGQSAGTLPNGYYPSGATVSTTVSATLGGSGSTTISVVSTSALVAAGVRNGSPIQVGSDTYTLQSLTATTMTFTALVTQADGTLGSTVSFGLYPQLWQGNTSENVLGIRRAYHYCAGNAFRFGYADHNRISELTAYTFPGNYGLVFDGGAHGNAFANVIEHCSASVWSRGTGYAIPAWYNEITWFDYADIAAYPAIDASSFLIYHADSGVTHGWTFDQITVGYPGIPGQINITNTSPSAPGLLMSNIFGNVAIQRDTFTNYPCVDVISINGKYAWQYGKNNDAQTGSNTGASWLLAGYDDNGSFLGNWVVVTRANGAILMPGALTVGSLTTAGDVNCDDVNATGTLNVVGGASAGSLAVGGLLTAGTATVAGVMSAQSVVSSSTIGSSSVTVDRPAGFTGAVNITTGGVNRISIYGSGTPESGNNVGTDEVHGFWADNGSFLGNWLTITRATGAVSMPGAVSVGTLAASGQVSVSIPTGGNMFVLNSPAGHGRGISWLTGGVESWVIVVNGVVQGGSNAGSDMNISGYSDTGTLLGNWVTITRANGNMTLLGGLTIGTSLKVSGNLGFYGTTPIAQQSITGSRSSGAALAQLLGALAANGLIANNSTT